MLTNPLRDAAIRDLLEHVAIEPDMAYDLYRPGGCHCYGESLPHVLAHLLADDVEQHGCLVWWKLPSTVIRDVFSQAVDRFEAVGSACPCDDCTRNPHWFKTAWEVLMGEYGCMASENCESGYVPTDISRAIDQAMDRMIDEMVPQPVKILDPWGVE